MFQSGCNYSKLKANLQLTIQRLRLLEKKKTEMAVKARKEIADYWQLTSRREHASVLSTLSAKKTRLKPWSYLKCLLICFWLELA